MQKKEILKYAKYTLIFALGIAWGFTKHRIKTRIENKNIKAEKTVTDSKEINANVITDKKEMILIYSDRCPHCHDAIEFIEKHIEPKFKDLTIKKYDVRTSEGNKIFKEYVKKFNVTGGYGVPFVVIGDNYQMGFAGDLTGEKYINLIQELK